MGKQIGYAVVGAGAVVERTVLPAFARAGGDVPIERGEVDLPVVPADRVQVAALA